MQKHVLSRKLHSHQPPANNFLSQYSRFITLSQAEKQRLWEDAERRHRHGRRCWWIAIVVCMALLGIFAFRAGAATTEVDTDLTTYTRIDGFMTPEQIDSLGKIQKHQLEFVKALKQSELDHAQAVANVEQESSLARHTVNAAFLLIGVLIAIAAVVVSRKSRSASERVVYLPAERIAAQLSPPLTTYQTALPRNKQNDTGVVLQRRERV